MVRVTSPDPPRQARLGLDRLAPIPAALDPNGRITPASIQRLDFVRWSPEGRSVAALAITGGLNDAIVLLFDVAGGGARGASLVSQGMSGLDWSPDGARLAFVGSEPRGRSSTRGVGTTDVANVATSQSRLLFVGDTLGWDSGRIPESVRWGTGSEVYFAVWRRDLTYDQPTRTLSTLYAVAGAPGSSTCG